MVLNEECLVRGRRRENELTTICLQKHSTRSKKLKERPTILNGATDNYHISRGAQSMAQLKKKQLSMKS